MVDFKNLCGGYLLSRGSFHFQYEFNTPLWASVEHGLIDSKNPAKSLKGHRSFRRTGLFTEIPISAVYVPRDGNIDKHKEG